MAQPLTSFDLSADELAKLPTEEKEMLLKEWKNRVEDAKRAEAAKTTSAAYTDHYGRGTPSQAFTHTNSYANTAYEAPYNSHRGGTHRGHNCGHNCGTCCGTSGIPSFSDLVRPSNWYNDRPRGRHHPYPQPQRQRHQNRTATFPHTSPLAKEQELKTTIMPCPAFSSTGIYTGFWEQNRLKPPPSPPDNTDTCVGICTRTECRRLHDQNKVGICKAFLYKDNCSNGDDCPLSHTPSPHNTIACNHFRNGACTKDDCKFAHIRVSPSAAVCEGFSRLGYCEKGSNCADRHAFDECPNFTNKGACKAGEDCPLVHVRHAGRLRKARLSAEAEHPLSRSSPENAADDKVPSTSARDMSDPFGRDTLDVAMNHQSDMTEGDTLDASNHKAGNLPYEKSDNHIGNPQATTHGLSQQADFVPFE